MSQRTKRLIKIMFVSRYKNRFLAYLQKSNERKTIKTRNVCEACMPPKLKCHCDLDLETPNSKASSTGHDQPTYQVRSDKFCLRTDRPTDMCKAIYPHFFEGWGHN